MYGLAEWEVKENRKAVTELTAEGYEFNVTTDGYFVKFKGKGLGGARVAKREHFRHWRHAQADLKEYLHQAVQMARRHQEGGR